MFSSSKLGVMTINYLMVLVWIGIAIRVLGYRITVKPVFHNYKNT